MTRKQSQTLQALRELISSQGNESTPRRLPRIRELAETLGVSPNTVATALRSLRDEGLITMTHRKGIWTTGKRAPRLPVDDPGSPQPGKLRWQEIKSSITHDIVSGKYPQGSTLPPIKFLSEQYGACFSTIRKALKLLEKEQILTQFKKRWRIHLSHVSKKTNRPVIIMITSDFSPEFFTICYDRGRQFRRQIESETINRGCDLVIFWLPEVIGYYHDLLPEYQRFQRFQKSRTIIGYVLWLSEPHPPGIQQLFAKLHEDRLPVSIINESDYPIDPALLKKNLKIREFSPTTGILPGRIMGNFLIEKGHDSVAWFSTKKGILWNDQRLNGLLNVMETYDKKDSVHTFEIRINELIDNVFSNYEPNAEPLTRLKTELNAIRNSLAEGCTFSDLDLYNRAREIFERDWQYRVLKPIFQEALKLQDVTVWIGSNDEIALAALIFLQENKIDVPQKISVVGFDDTDESFAKRLTTYNFNLKAIAVAMVDHILGGPFIQAYKPSGAIIEIPGFIIERGTTQ